MLCSVLYVLLRSVQSYTLYFALGFVLCYTVRYSML